MSLDINEAKLLKDDNKRKVVEVVDPALNIQQICSLMEENSSEEEEEEDSLKEIEEDFKDLIKNIKNRNFQNSDEELEELKEFLIRVENLKYTMRNYLSIDDIVALESAYPDLEVSDTYSSDTLGDIEIYKTTVEYKKDVIQEFLQKITKKYGEFNISYDILRQELEKM